MLLIWATTARHQCFSLHDGMIDLGWFGSKRADPFERGSPLRESGSSCSTVLPRLFVNNRRDGARLISSVLVLFTISATQFHQAWGPPFTLLFAALSLFWGFAYRRLDR